MTDATKVDSYKDLLDNARSITAMPGFAAWKKMLDEQIEGRQRQAVEPMKAMDEVLERNYSNGEIAGMMAAAELWKLLIESCETEIQRTKDKGESE